MNDLTELAHVAWQYKPWIWWPPIVLIFALYSGRFGWETWVYERTGLSPDTGFLILLQAILVPIFAFATWYCYQFPERIGDPFDDMRIIWPLPAIVEAAMLWITARLVWKDVWFAWSQYWLARARRLAAEGRHEASHAAYRTYLHILCNKLGTKPTSTVKQEASPR